MFRGLDEGKMKTISDAEIKSEIEQIASRIDTIVKTINRYYPESDSPVDAESSQSATGDD